MIVWQTLTLAFLTVTAPPSDPFGVGLTLNARVPDQLFQPEQMPDDRRRQDKEGTALFLQQQGNLIIRQRGGWTPKMLPAHQRVLEELARITHVEVHVWSPPG